MWKGRNLRNTCLTIPLSYFLVTSHCCIKKRMLKRIVWLIRNVAGKYLKWKLNGKVTECTTQQTQWHQYNFCVLSYRWVSTSQWLPRWWANGRKPPCYAPVIMPLLLKSRQDTAFTERDKINTSDLCLCDCCKVI